MMVPLESPPTVPPLPPEEHVCDACGFAYLEVSVEQASTAIARLPVEIRDAVRAIPETCRQVRPDDVTWSVTEYVCHVRDVLSVSTIRLHRTRTETSPALEPMLNDLRALRFRYRQRPLEPVLDELAAVAEGLGDEIAEFAPGDWQRTATRLQGETRTARWLLRHAAHEGAHHLRDIIDVGRRVAGDDSR